MRLLLVIIVPAAVLMVPFLVLGDRLDAVLGGPALMALLAEAGPWAWAVGIGLVVLGISMDGPETIADVGPYARRQGVTFPVLLDEDTRVTSIYNPRRAAPLVVFIGLDGRVASVREGFLQGDEVQVEQTIKQLLGKAGPEDKTAAPQAAN